MGYEICIINAGFNSSFCVITDKYVFSRYYGEDTMEDAREHKKGLCPQ